MENSGHLEIEALETLIKAVQVYQEELLENRKILTNAGIVCDAAMGSDDISKQQIAHLNEALEELKKTSDLAAEVSAALIEDKLRAIDVIESSRRR